MRSVFNWNFDLYLPRYGNIAESEFWFCLILLNIIYIIAIILRQNKRSLSLCWILNLVFCLYAFWDIDYFNLADGYYAGLKDFRDYLYTLFIPISFHSYIIFRLYIWGAALFIYYLILRFNNINPNIGIYIFSFFFLLTFSYARVSLGMVFYFCGLSILISKQYNFFNKGILIILCFIFSYWAHRSMAFLIVLTPLIYLPLKRKIIFICICIIPLFSIAIDYGINLIGGGIMTDSDAVGIAMTQYSSYTITQEMNWKYKLITSLHYWGFYIPTTYILYKFYLKPKVSSIPKNITYFFSIVLICNIAGVILISSSALGLWIIGYRILYMAGIPLCIILAYLYQYKLLSIRALTYLMSCMVLYGEAFIIGKIISFH